MEGIRFQPLQSVERSLIRLPSQSAAFSSAPLSSGSSVLSTASREIASLSGAPEIDFAAMLADVKETEATRSSAFAQDGIKDADAHLGDDAPTDSAATMGDMRGVSGTGAANPILTWASEIPIQPLDGSRLVESPGVLRFTGNAEADGLVDRVMQLRGNRGMSVDDASRDVASAQSALVALGYEVGAYGPFGNGVDGILGNHTSDGLRQFQQDHALSVTGTLTAETSNLLLQVGKPALDGVSANWQSELAQSPFAADAYQGTANPFWYVRFAAENGDDASTMANIDPVFKGRLAALARDAGQPAVFGEGFRSLERQSWFYQRYLNGEGPLAAKPGQSKHNMGLAVDTQSDWLRRIGDGVPVERQTALLEYGLYKPLADEEGTSHEAWHIQPLEVRIGGA